MIAEAGRTVDDLERKMWDARCDTPVGKVTSAANALMDAHVTRA